MSDMPLFDSVNGVRRRDAAMERGEKSAGEAWKEAALHAIRACAHRYDFFTTDQVEEVMERLGVPKTHDLRALGSLMRRAQSMNICFPTNSIETSKLAKNHRRPKRVWKSLVK